MDQCKRIIFRNTESKDLLNWLGTNRVNAIRANIWDQRARSNRFFQETPLSVVLVVTAGTTQLPAEDKPGQSNSCQYMGPTLTK